VLSSIRQNVAYAMRRTKSFPPTGSSREFLSVGVRHTIR